MVATKIVPSRSSVWAQLGDSRTMFGAQNSAGATFTTKDATEVNTPVGRRNQGYQFWCEFLSQGAMRLPQSLNFGYAGGTIVGTNGVGNGVMNYLVQPCITAALAAKAAGVIFWIGTNDINTNNAPASAVIAMKDSIISQITAAGLRCILLTDTPRGSASAYTGLRATAANLKTMLSVRAWDLQQADRENVTVVDLYDRFVSPSSSNGDWYQDDYTFDGVHQSPKSAQYIAQKLLAAARPFLGFPNPQLFSGNSDAYNASTNPWGCVSANPSLSGTGGTVGTNGSGTLGTSWANFSSGRSGWTAVYSQVTSNDGGGTESWAQIALSGTAGAGSQYDGFVQFMNTTMVPVGSRVQVVGKCQWDAPLTGVSGVYCGLFVGRSSGSALLYDGAESNMRLPLDTGALTGTFKTEPYVIPSDATAINLIVGIALVPSAAVAATVRVRSVGVRFV